MSSKATIERDILVIGAGPVGLYATYCAGLRGLSVALVDSLPEPGGQVSALYPEKPIFDVGGFPAVKGRELVRGLWEQAEQFEPRRLLGSQVVSLERLGDDRWTASLSADEDVACRAVVICAGIGTFTPRPLPALANWLGRGMEYFVTDVETHAGRDVVIAGGGDSAFDWALALEGVARSVTLVHRRGTFRAHEYTVSQVLASSVRVVTDAVIEGGRGGDWLEHLEVTSPGGSLALPAQQVIAALGFTANLGPVRTWGLGIVDGRYITVDSTMATNLRGIYAAGDITDYRGKVRLISVGFGEAATAINNAAVLIDPSTSVFPGHSTDNPQLVVALRR